jgi:hypothetical protein
VIVYPGSDGVVDVLDDCDASDKQCEDSEHEAADERQRKRERQK